MAIDDISPDAFTNADFSGTIAPGKRLEGWYAIKPGEATSVELHVADGYSGRYAVFLLDIPPME